MWKTVVFQGTAVLRQSWDRATSIECGFYFYVVDSSLVEEPEWMNEASSHRIKVTMALPLLINWRLARFEEGHLITPDEEAVVKVLFHYGKQHIKQKIKEGILSEYEELHLSPANCPGNYPPDISRIPIPDGHKFTIEISGQVDQSMSTRAAGEPTVDIAILTVLPQEYRAVHDRLVNPRSAPTSASTPNLYAWVLGEISTPKSGEPYSVALGMLVRPGTNRGALATQDAIARWKPRYIFFVGIAGGFELDDLRKGDVVIADVIYGYGYGKLEKEFLPRHDWTYRTDEALLTGATAFATLHPNWTNGIGVDHPEQGTPKALIGKIASGDELVDDPTNEFFASVIKAWPKLQAVEMEGAGAATTIEQAQSRGTSVGFLMIRGISDMPRPPDLAPEIRGTQERDLWKDYAAKAAATFAVSYIASGLPVSPRESVQEDSTVPQSDLSRPPKLTLKLFQMGRSQKHQDEIVFDQEGCTFPNEFKFGLALENTEASTIAREIDIQLTFWWQGEDPKGIPQFQGPPDTEQWKPEIRDLVNEQHAMMTFHDSELTCPFGHSRRWKSFKVTLNNRVNGYFDIRYTVSSAIPYTHKKGMLRITMV